MLGRSRLGAPRLSKEKRLVTHKSLPAVHNSMLFKSPTLTAYKSASKICIPIIDSLSPIIYASTSSSKLCPEVDTSVIIIKILSNWGATDKLSLSSIYLLDCENIPLRVIDISSVPLCESSNIEKLVDRDLVKVDAKSIWTVPWPPEGHDSVSIIIVVDSSRPPSTIRIWNPSIDSDSSVKDIEISYNSHIVFRGEIPAAFGSVCQLNIPNKAAHIESDILLSSLFPELEQKEEGLADSFGWYPLEEAKSITLDIRSSWGGDGLLGIREIDIFNEILEVVKWGDIEEVQVKNCLSFTDPSCLFKSQNDSIEKTFMMETRWNGWPSIEIVFKKKIKVSQIQFYNTDRTPSGFSGMKDLRILTNKRVIWSGRLKGGTGTQVWLTDFPEIRRREFQK